MNHHGRLLKTLLSLVVAMTVVTELLSWLGAFHPQAVMAARDATEFRNRVAALVHEQVRLRGDRWQDFELVPSDRPTDSFLTALSDSSDHHFHIDEHGRVSRTPRWEAQEPLADKPSTVRIALAARADSPAWSPLQQRSTDVLIAVLDDALGRETADFGGASFPPTPGSPSTWSKQLPSIPGQELGLSLAATH